MTPEYDLNANINQCIKAIEYIGHTTYLNICNGKSYDVPWGTAWIVQVPLFLGVMLLIFWAMWRVINAPE